MTQHPVDSTHLPCCNAIGQHAAGCSESLSQRMRAAADALIADIPDVAVPPTVQVMWDWQLDADEPPYRMLYGGQWTVTDHEARIETRAMQRTDGSLEDAGVDMHVGDDPLNSDQARELAAALLEAAAELDGWVAR